MKPSRSHGNRLTIANLPSLVTMLEDMASTEGDNIPSVHEASYKNYVKAWKSRTLVSLEIKRNSQCQGARKVLWQVVEANNMECRD